MTKRNFQPGQHFHVYNRGNNRNVVFRDSSDRVYFLSQLDRLADRYGCRLLAYCLMDNHFHLALRQDTDTPISALMQALVSGYTQRYNRKYGTVGPLFQNRFQAKFIPDEEQMARLTRYIHRNPQPFRDFHKFRWSSYRQYAQGKSGISEPGPVLDFFGGSGTSYAIFCEKG